MNLLASSSDSASGGALAFIITLSVIWAVVVIIGWWKIFTKAGQPGWAALIPIYNLYIMCKVAGRSGAWIILFLIPIVNVVAYWVLMLDIAKSFGKGLGFWLGLVFFNPIFSIILGFGSATYRGPVVGTVQSPLSI